MMDELKQLGIQLDYLAVFRDLWENKVFSAFHEFLHHSDDSEKEFCRYYTAFVGCLYHANTENWTEYLKKIVLSMETPVTDFAVQGKEIPICMEKSIRKELWLLSKVASVSSELVKGQIRFETRLLPDWIAEPTDLGELYFDRLKHIHQYGFGIWAKYHMFQMKLTDKSVSGYQLKPVTYPDTIQIRELIGYDLQRKQVIDNTEALLNGLKASNILLYGSAGTGKSATVKAVANAYADKGLRLIELSKNELHLLPELLEELNANPLKFILFIDDLSFQDNDDNFSALKAVLEGSISARANNTVIYATSNRRHIVRETFSQRAGDEVHRNDTMQETISLSERFGIQILFDKPNKDVYLDIVMSLANEAGLKTDRDTLAVKAEQFAIRKSGRSARAARQFVEQVRCMEYKEGSDC